MDRPSAGRPWRYTEWRRAGSPSGQPRARRGGPRSRAPDPHQESRMIRRPLALALAVAALGSPAVAAAADSTYDADREMSDAGIITPSDPSATKPHKRAYLIGKGLLDLDDAEHSDKGFDQAFRILTQDDVTSELFGDGVGDIGYVDDWTGSCAGKGVPTGLGDLADALEVIGDADDQFAAGGGGPTIRDLFDRADERLGTFDDWDATFYRQIVDPDSDDEPHEVYGC